MASVHKRPLARGGSAWSCDTGTRTIDRAERSFRTAADARTFAKTADADVVRGDFVNPTLARPLRILGRSVVRHDRRPEALDPAELRVDASRARRSPLRWRRQHPPRPRLGPVLDQRLRDRHAVDIARGNDLDPAYPTVATGRELARYFESKAPGLAHRLALNYLLPRTNWSPPRQVWAWVALDVAIYSALAALWYYKWAAASVYPACRPDLASPSGSAPGRWTTTG